LQAISGARGGFRRRSGLLKSLRNVITVGGAQRAAEVAASPRHRRRLACAAGPSTGAVGGERGESFYRVHNMKFMASVVVIKSS
jgi:hypothetical protein